MKRQPRRIALTKSIKLPGTKHVSSPRLPYYGGLISARRTVRLFWFNFETLRLQLTWALTPRRRMSRKMFFKQKARNPLPTQGLFRKKSALARLRGHVWYTGFPHLAYTQKSTGSRMGRGKGGIKGYYYKWYAGSPLLYINGYSNNQLRYACYKANKCLPGGVVQVYLSSVLPLFKWN